MTEQETEKELELAMTEIKALRGAIIDQCPLGQAEAILIQANREWREEVQPK